MKFNSSVKEKINAWWQAARPPFYIATLAPVFLGLFKVIKDYGYWNKLTFITILIVCFIQHLAANLCNDYYDSILGTDTDDSIGGSRVVQEGKITLGQLRVVICVLYILSCLFTIGGYYFLKLPYIWLIMIVAMFSSYFYVAPPIKYGYRALGEFFVFINMGAIMTCGTYYVLTGFVNSSIFYLSIPIGLMVAGILFYQSIPEIILDKNAGKLTLANTIGYSNSILLLKIWWPLVWFILFLLWYYNYCSWFVFLGIGASLFFYRKLLQKISQNKSDLLNLNSYGYLVRAMYAFGSVFLILSVV